MGEERASTLETLKTELKDAESKHETLLKELQATYKASMDGLEKLKEESAPKIKLLKAATQRLPRRRSRKRRRQRTKSKLQLLFVSRDKGVFDSEASLLLCPMIAGVEPLRGQAHVAACACRSRCASDMTPGLINSLIGGEDRGDASMPLS